MYQNVKLWNWICNGQRYRTVCWLVFNVLTRSNKSCSLLSICLNYLTRFLLTDVDECTLGAHDCGPLYHCRNTPGSYRCDPKTCKSDEVMDQSTGECTSITCPAGFAAKDGKCEGK